MGVYSIYFVFVTPTSNFLPVSRAFSSAWLLVFVLAACARSEIPGQLDLSGLTMGTTYSVTIPRPPNSVESETIKRTVDAILTDANLKMSTYLSDSELSLFNNFPTTDWVDMSIDLHRVIRLALAVSEKSGGAFDITVAPLVNLWGFGPESSASKAIPTNHAIQSQLNHTGYKMIELRDSPPGIRKKDPKVTVDLSAIAKGYGVDLLADYLDSLGIGNYLVEIGGEIRVRGVKARGQPWRLAIEKPVVHGRFIHRVVLLQDQAIATSGDYRNFFESNDRRFSHTIDPRTGKPVAHRLASVSVVSHTAVYADAMATALMVLGPEKGVELAEREGVAALFMIKSDDGFIDKITNRFAQEVGT